MLHDLLYQERDFIIFVFLTVVLGGGAGFLAGRAVAATWRSGGQLIPYMLALGAAIRFLHYALFGATLLSLHYYAVDTIVAAIGGFIGFAIMRRRQMTHQYGMLGDR
jgi:hypothetical protein